MESEHTQTVELNKLKKDLECYRELLLPVNKVIEWEQNYYPAIIVGVIMLKFMTAEKENQYEEICKRILNAKHHVINAKNYIVNTKQEKPTLFLLGLIAAFGALAWFGSMIDNLFLTYLIVTALALAPGARKSGLFDKLSKQASDQISAIKNKAKTN